MIVLFRTANLVEAKVMASYLIAHGLDARLLDGETMAALPVVGGVRLAVPADEEAQARRLLAEAEARFSAAGEAEDRSAW